MGVMHFAFRGATAGILATAAMDLLWYRRYRAGGGESRFVGWELSSPAATFDDAPAPAKVGKLVAAKMGIDLPDSFVSATNIVVHWATGIGWGKAAGVASSVLPIAPATVGVLTGATAWGTSYAALGAVGIYEPITSYDRRTLWKDLSAHLVFGSVLGAVLSGRRALSR